MNHTNQPQKKQEGTVATKWANARSKDVGGEKTTINKQQVEE